MRLIIRIIINALAVLLAASVVPGIRVAGFGTAVLVAIVFGLLNITLGFIIKVLTFPLAIITFGIFLLVVNALMFWAASFIKGFSVAGFGPAFWGALIVTAASVAGKRLFGSRSPYY